MTDYLGSGSHPAGRVEPYPARSLSERIRQQRDRCSDTRTLLNKLLDQVQHRDGKFTGPERTEAERLNAQLRDEAAVLEALRQQEPLEKSTGGPPPFEPLNSPARAATPSAGGKASYRSLFGEPTDRGPFKNWSAFVSAIETGEIRSLQSGIPSGAGFVVPHAYAAEIIGPALEATVALSRSRIFPVMRAGSITVPGWDVTSHASSLFGGVTASWVAEAGDIVETDHKTRAVELTPRKLVASTSVTRELEADSFDGFAAMLRASLSDAVSFYADDALLWGSGAGQPLGVFNSPCLVTVDKEAAQDADTINAQNVGKMWSRLLPQCAAAAVWVCSPSALPQLYSMTINANAVGFGVFVPAGGFSAAPYASLFGRPLIVSEKMKALGDLGDILLADFSMYGVALAQEVRIDRSEHVHWSTDRAAYRAIIRLDGQPLLAAPLTPKRGSETLGAFVTLAERAT